MLPESLYSAPVGENGITTIREATAYCGEFAVSRGFPYFMLLCHLRTDLARPIKAVLTNYPRDWLQHYEAAGYEQVDPVLLRLRGDVRPFAWDEIEQTTSAVRRLYEEAADVGLANGVTVPMHCPNGEQAALSLAGVDPVVQGDAREELYAQTWLFLTRTFAALRRLVVQAQGVPAIKRLSPRQQQVLAMLAEGLGFKEMSERTGLHRRTLEDAMKKAMAKLGVSSREQAIVQALATGELQSVSYSMEFLLIDGENLTL